MTRCRVLCAGLTLALLGAVAAPARAQEPRSAREWTGANTALALAATAAIALDCGTTLDLRNHPEWGESNPLLPARPTTGRIVATCGAALVGTWAVAALLPSPYRNLWLGLIVGVETWAGANNLLIGARLQLP